MAKPPNFTGHSHAQMKALLKAEDTRQNSKSDWKLVGHLGLTGFISIAVIAALGMGLLQILGVFR